MVGDVKKEMSEHESDKEKHVTAATTSEPQEEFIDTKAQPSRDRSEVSPPPDKKDGAPAPDR